VSRAVPGTGRLLGVDYGAVRVGLALSDPERRLATPYRMYERHTEEEDAAFFRELVTRERVQGIVIGLPRLMRGAEGVSAERARRFGDWLAHVTGLPVVYWDERLTTRAAERALWQAGLPHKQRKARRDKVAAAILLQNYLDAGCPFGP